ncbi:MAG: UvrD-helicase domain-containing protein [Pseudomonadales bacterium]
MSFDPAKVVLCGRHLIEASAGTGKTYSIANLFLRLLLEPHPSQTDNQALTIDKILVVTFTNAATDELRGRIRQKIVLALQYLRGGSCDDGFIQQYMGAMRTPAEKETACIRLNNALLLVDDAAIFTIHSFAVRAMQTFLFETGALADAEVQIGGSDRDAQHLGDMARLLALGEQSKLGFYLKKNGINLKKYIAVLNGYSKRDVPTVSNAKKGISVIDQYEKTRADLIKERERLLSTQGFFIDSTEKTETDAIKQRILEALSIKVHGGSLNAIIKRAFYSFQKSNCYLGDINKEVYQQIIDATPSKKCEAQIFCQIVKNIFEYKANEDLIKSSLQALQQALYELLKVRKLPLQLAQMQPDDVIGLMNERLSDTNTAGLLKKVLTEQYPVCMVDEFQDTDPEQFLLFDRLYQGQAHCGLFAIGDPKQSIYAFRGADVFAYLDVRAGIHKEAIHSLDTNFRSKQGVMDGVNALFKESSDNPVFVYSGIEYEPVYSLEKPPEGRGIVAKDLGVYRVGKQEPDSLVFIGNPNESSETFNNTKRLYAEDCAERILSLLQGKDCATIEKKGNRVALSPSDIAVLVSDYSQANAIKDALAQKNLSAVYLAQKDSVFQRCTFAQDLLFVLRAMDEPSSLFHLKAAFATPLLRHFKLETHLLDSLDTDAGFESAIQCFNKFRQCWDEKGIFPALYSLFSEYHLDEVFALQWDGDRLMTDFRHLGDLLQQQYLLTGSRERVIDWYAAQLNDDSELDEDAKSLRLESDANLIKIVTLHGCKGLEYPVVFMPFFFGFKTVDIKSDAPFYHQKEGGKEKGNWKAVLDFQSEPEVIQQAMEQERMAEQLRLLYVGITRAIYQCYIGISSSHYSSDKNQLLPKSCWGHLLALDKNARFLPWETLQSKLEQRMDGAACTYETLLALSKAIYKENAKERKSLPLVQTLPERQFPSSSWLITSYSALAYQKEARVSAGSKQDEAEIEVVIEAPLHSDAVATEENIKQWQQNIRFTLRGGTTTGDCLHKVFERMADGEALDEVLDSELRIHGLLKPEGKQPEPALLDEVIVQRKTAIAQWLNEVLQTPLNAAVPSLQTLFDEKTVLPECEFDFSLGDDRNAATLSSINSVLTEMCGASTGIARKDNQKQINGFMTGSIDLLFIHNKTVYVLDYKSNTLGKTPHCYDHAAMEEAMRDSRYDLQYLTYSVAAHRYMQQRLQERYDYDTGEYRFGGVFYLFLRGMGVEGYANHGIYFKRPSAQQIQALSAAFSGEEVQCG